MFLAIRDLRRGIRRFLLVGLVVTLIATLSTVLAALADGLVRDGTSGLRALPVTDLAFQPHARSVFSRSTLDDRALQAWDQAPHVTASPLGMSFVNAEPLGSGPNLDLAMFGIADESFLLPNPQARASMAEPGTLVLADELRDEGAKVGDRYRVTGADVDLRVVGFTFAGSYGHVPIAYTSLDTWRSIAYGSDPRGRFSAIAIKTESGADLAAANRAAGTETVTKSQAYDGSPGYSAETATMTLIRSFLVVIAALVVGAFFTVLTIQRTKQIGLLKAMGASNAYVLRDGVGQMGVVVVAGTLVGLLLGTGLVEVMASGQAPVELTTSAIVVTVASMVGAGLVGSLVAFRRITNVEPAIALGTEH